MNLSFPHTNLSELHVTTNKRICDDDDDTTIIIISIITANYHVVLALHSYHCDCKFSADLVFFYATNES